MAFIVGLLSSIVRSGESSYCGPLVWFFFLSLSYLQTCIPPPVTRTLAFSPQSRTELKSTVHSCLELPREASIEILGYGHRKFFTATGRASSCLLVVCTHLTVQIDKLARDKVISSLNFRREKQYDVLFISHSSILKFWHQVQRMHY